jgi:LmbE family N-acetylglucosaminyl deacetylase
MGKILVVSAHPDDEVLGVGGTMLRHIAAGDEVCWLIVTNIFEKQGFDKSLVEKRQKEIDLVAQTMKIEKVIKLDYPTMTLS